MKSFFLALIVTTVGWTPIVAQNLQVSSLNLDSTASFQVDSGTPGATLIICYSNNGTGPFTLANGIVLDLSLPIKSLSPFTLNVLGEGTLGPLRIPRNALFGMDVWFQGVQLDIWSNPIYSVTNTVHATVGAPVGNNPPIGFEDLSSVVKNGSVLIDVLSNDAEFDGDAISLFSVSDPTHGTVVSLPSGKIQYNPSLDYVGRDTFTYIAQDIYGAQSAATTVDIEVGNTIVEWGAFTNDRARDVRRPVREDIVQISTRAGAWSAVSADGSLNVWGDYSSRGKISDAPTGNNFTMAEIGEWHGVALRIDGSLVSWGDDSFSQVSSTPTGTDFVQVSAGYWHSVALRTDGSLVSWGWDGYSQVASTPSVADFLQASAGMHHSVALRSNGRLVVWGDDTYGQVSDTPSGTGFVQVSAGGEHTVALHADGSLTAWGRDNHGQVANTPLGNDFVAVSSGFWHSIALRADGSLVSWGYDSWDQVTDTPVENNFTLIAAGSNGSMGIIQ